MEIHVCFWSFQASEVQMRPITVLLVVCNLELQLAPKCVLY